MAFIQTFYRFITEPLKPSNHPSRPLLCRMAMRWSHFPKGFKRLPCLFIGHRWERWEPIKYILRGVERNCKTCGELETKLYTGIDRA